MIKDNNTATIEIVIRAFVECNTKTANALPAGVAPVLTNWTETVDATNSFNPTTGIFTCPRNGRYRVTFSTAIEILQVNAYYGLRVTRNGVDVKLVNMVTVNTFAVAPFLTGVITCVAGDTLAVTAFNGGLSTNEVIAPAHNTLTIEELLLSA